MLHRNKLGAFSALLVGLGLGLAAGCPSSDACLVGADCPSGACAADGTCVPVVDGTDGSGTDTNDGTDTAGSEDTAPADSSDGGETEGDGETDTGAELCLPPNADGLIERAELPLEAGLDTTFLVTQDVAFDSAGTMVGDMRQWDFDVMLTGDHLAIGQTESIEGRWFAPLFPGATYAARLSETNDLLGVFEATETALVLRGVVSPTDGIDRTELSYEPPATVMSFPLWLGQTWSTESTVSGLAQGIAAFYTERYDGEVDAEGTAITPYAELPVLRVNVLLTRTIGVLPTTLRTQSFVSECFGSVAQLRSDEGVDADAPEFTQAAEIRRLSP